MISLERKTEKEIYIWILRHELCISSTLKEEFSGISKTWSNPPQSINHEFLFFFPHTDRQQRSDLTQGGQEVDGVLHWGSTDGVSLPHGSEQLPNAVILPSEQAKHLADKFWVLDMALLCPADHRLRDQLLQAGWKEHWVKMIEILLF